MLFYIYVSGQIQRLMFGKAGASFSLMESAASMQSVASLENVGDFARSQLERWCLVCQSFLEWEKEHILQGEPSGQQQREHQAALKWLLRVTRLIHASAADPDFHDRSTADMIAMTVWKLEQSWRMIYESMPEPEAQELLAKIFPE